VHRSIDLKVLYFGTPVVVISSRNPDGTTNLAPMSSAWWLGQSGVLGLANSSQTAANLRRERECVVNLAPSSMVDRIDRLALTTGRSDVPEYKRVMGYQYVADKFAVAGLTRQPADLVGAARVGESPIQLECVVTQAHPIDGPDVNATAFQVHVRRVHVDESLVIPGTSHIDPLGWDPLIMKFCEFFGDARAVHPSRLAEAWAVPRAIAVAA
jgi:flavin reductase (DIM6/NTAB) family NADH-FMN oxidoreductase RutF